MSTAYDRVRVAFSGAPTLLGHLNHRLDIGQTLTMEERITYEALMDLMEAGQWDRGQFWMNASPGIFPTSMHPADNEVNPFPPREATVETRIID